MKRTGRRLAATAAAASLTLLLAACGGGAESSQAGGQEQPPPKSEQTQQKSSKDMPAAQGKTTIDDIYGPAAGKVPTDPSNEGSAKGMADDPVATAASNNPLLTKLTKAVKTAGLVDTLNKPDAGYTVFAPVNAAFDELPPETLKALLTDPSKKDELKSILTYHVVPKRYDAQALGKAGSVTTVNGAKVDITGKGKDIEVNGAKVLVGNVPTANATVFVIDEVLMPPKN